MPFAKSKDCLGALPGSKEGTPVWQGKPVKYIQCLFMGVGSEVQGGSVLAHWLRCAELATLSRLSAAEPKPGLEAASGAKNLAHHARQEWLIPVQVPSRVKAIFKAVFPLACWPFKYWWGIVCLSAAWTPCHSLALQLTRGVALRPCCLFAVVEPTAIGHQHCTSDACFLLEELKGNDDTCHH